MSDKGKGVPDSRGSCVTGCFKGSSECSHLLQQVVQKPHVGLLSLDSVGEEGVRLPADDLLLRRPLHSDYQRRLRDVLLNDSPGLHVVLKPKHIQTQPNSRNTLNL